MRKRNIRKKESASKTFFKNFFLKGKTLTFIFVMSALGMSFVFIRMKGVEQDYQYSDYSNKIKEKRIENKELKAEKARELSVKKLWSFANEHNLKEPDENHIIVIPNE